MAQEKDVELKNIGTGFTQDRSIEVLRNIDEFMRKHLDDDRVFMARLAFKPCLIIASNPLAIECGTESVENKLYNGLKNFVHGLFGDSILFLSGNDAMNVKKHILPLFNCAALQSYEHTIQTLTSAWLHDLKTLEDKSVILYHSFKRLALAVNLKLFLDIDGKEQPEFFETLSSLTTTHWHGIISVPVSFKLSFLMSSSYRNAMDAKDKLLEIIEDRIGSNQVAFLNQLKQDSGWDLKTLKNHILIFVCALIPKALASLLSSTLDNAHLWYSKYVDAPTGHIEEDNLENIILEVMRLWPPFPGSLRIAHSDVQIGKYSVKKDHAIFVASVTVNRDPSVFLHPDEFMPERWSTFNKEDRNKIFCFGNGLRKCPGDKFVLKFLKLILRDFLVEFTWDFTYSETKPRKLKYMPVTRSANLEKVTLKQRH